MVIRNWRILRKPVLCVEDPDAGGGGGGGGEQPSIADAIADVNKAAAENDPDKDDPDKAGDDDDDKGGGDDDPEKGKDDPDDEKGKKADDDKSTDDDPDKKGKDDEDGKKKEDDPEKGKDDPEKGKKGEDDPEKGKDDEAAFEFSEESKTDFAKFSEEAKAYLETVEGIPDELTTILERQEAQIAELTAVAEPVTNFGGIERIQSLVGALDKVFETVGEPGNYKPNAGPLVTALLAEIPKESGEFAAELFSADSRKYHGMSVFQEVMIDAYKATPEKLKNIDQYLRADVNIPIIPTGLPKGIDQKHTQAWIELDEQKRHDITGIINDIDKLRKELADGEVTEAHKGEHESKIVDLERKLQAENNTLARLQKGIDDGKENQETRDRQIAAREVQVSNHVVDTYNTRVFNMGTAFVLDIAPKLTYLDEANRVPAANDMMARIFNALETDQKTGKATPTAAYTAEQLKKEGVKFDFIAGGEKLHSFYLAIDKLERLKIDGASPGAIKAAERELNKLESDVKAEEVDLMGQISARYAGGATKQLEKQVTDAKKKKLAIRPKIEGNADKGGRGGKDDRKAIKTDIDRFNQKVRENDDD